MPNRALDWFNQALRDLAQAEASRRDERHEWACFAAHQAAEKAVKATHYRFGQDAWGHDVAGLLRALPAAAAIPAELMEKGRVLDNFYLPTRYPNGHAAGIPGDHYGPLQSEEAIRYAREIVEFARAQMA